MVAESNVLDNDQKILVKQAVRNLAMLRPRLSSEQARQAAGDLTWDLSALLIKEVQEHDQRDVEQIKDALAETGADRLNLIAAGLKGDKEKFALAETRAMLKVAGLVPQKEQAQAKNWVAQVTQPPEQASGRGR